MNRLILLILNFKDFTGSIFIFIQGIRNYSLSILKLSDTVVRDQIQ